MGLYKYIRETNRQSSPELDAIRKQRLIEWRAEPVTVRIERPTRLDRARSLGYKPKPGIFLIRQRVSRGGHQRPTIRKGRRPAHFRRRLVLAKSYRLIAEQRTTAKYTNCEVLGSYEAGKDGKHYWYEIIMVDRSHPSVLASDLAWIADHKGRAYRGVTTAGKRSRGLFNKGRGAEKLRPSMRSQKRRGTN